MSLPRFVALTTTFKNKYLSVREDGFVEEMGELPISSLAKFEIEVATSGNGKYVHIRSCYNNKYWVRSWQDGTGLFVVAGAEEPEEDQSKRTCTLFEPIFPNAPSNTIVRFRVVPIPSNTIVQFPYPASRSPPYNGCLYLGYNFIGDFPIFNHDDRMTVIDLESLVVLPKYISLKGDNDLYLSSRTDTYLEFAESDIGDQRVAYEVVNCGDGSIRLKSIHTQRFWRLGANNWIMADSTDTTCNNANTKFWAVKVANNAIALRNLSNNAFCKIFTNTLQTNCLNANDPTITLHARLLVEEPVISRQIYNVIFRLSDARIYNQIVLDMATAESTNSTTEHNTMHLRLSYTDTKTGHWNANLSLTLGAKYSFSSKIPFITEWTVELGVEFTGSYEWGEEWTSSRELEAIYEVTVPPMTKVSVKLIATQGICDVPFSYVTRDVLYNGTTQISQQDGGVYTGINSYNFQFVAEERSLQNDALLNVRVLDFKNPYMQ